MIIKSATGDVDLGQPENVRRGMLFRVRVDPAVYGKPTRDIVAACDENFGFDAGAPVEFLGCHPAIARREDCERLGIPLRCEQHGVPDAPIDAGAHGFARTRDGFAVDLWRERLPAGSRVRGVEKERTLTCSGWPLMTERFIGLDVRHARPEDVERLCCGAVGPGQARPRCSLAIGEHAEHESIAAGVKWANPVRSIPGLLTFERANFGGIPFPEAPFWPDRLDRMKRAMAESPGDLVVPRGPLFSARAEQRAKIAFCVADADGTVRDVASLYNDRTFSCGCGSADPTTHKDGCELPWQYRAAVFSTATVIGTWEDVGAAIQRTLLGASCVALLAWAIRLWDASPAAKRAACEAPLVALVNAVPADLDPVGWRAAVLCASEARVTPDPNTLAWWIRQPAGGNEPPPVVAYRRALAPHKAPPPERRQGGKAPRLTVDDGRDE